MNLKVYLIDLEVHSLLIDDIYSITWSVINETYKAFLSESNIFICPHTIEKIDGSKCGITYKPQNCNICNQVEFLGISSQYQYRYMISGIIYFLLEGKENLKQFYNNQKFFFLKGVNEDYILDQFTFRSILQIMTREDYQQKVRIFDMLPELNKPQILKEFLVFQYHVFLLSPCLGTPIKRAVKSGLFYLLSYQKLLIDLKEIQQQIGLDKLLPTPCIHNLFIDAYNHNYCNFRINVFQTNPICLCDNFKLETILYTLLTGEVQNGNKIQEMNQCNIKDKMLIFNLQDFLQI